MEDYFDEGEFMDDDQFEDSLEDDLEMDKPCVDDPEMEDKPDDAESQEDDFTAKDAFLAGSFAGWAYEEVLEQWRRKRLSKKQSTQRKRKKFSDDSE